MGIDVMIHSEALVVAAISRREDVRVYKTCL